MARAVPTAAVAGKHHLIHGSYGAGPAVGHGVRRSSRFASSRREVRIWVAKFFALSVFSFSAFNFSSVFFFTRLGIIVYRVFLPFALSFFFFPMISVPLWGVICLPFPFPPVGIVFVSPPQSPWGGDKNY